ncbi:hypothetical protein LIZ34_03700 [Intestinimonas butyriciproducens]|uniref:hypothetical protein n=1 Tax=Intestinimonas butyriciproducens TaxID=1297617 RepID=UPI001D074559|nr:hypothetical protein [Intestinimonas butyriciproducens]MCB7049476.1 hypothetical protein [Intestinimonas butyriciproducens]
MKKINNTIRYINDNQALVTKAFEKQARIFNSPEFKLWREYKAMFPEAEMVTKNIKRNTTKRTYKNLTYANMERFLQVQPNGKELVKELNAKKEAASIEANPYRVVLAWFLKKYDYDKYMMFFENEEAKKKSDTDKAEGENTEETSASEETAAEITEAEDEENELPMASNF